MRSRSAIIDLAHREREIMRVSREIREPEAIRTSRGPGGSEGVFLAYILAGTPDKTAPFEAQRMEFGDANPGGLLVGEKFWVLPMLHGRGMILASEIATQPFDMSSYYPFWDKQSDVIPVFKAPAVSIPYAAGPGSPKIQHFTTTVYVKWDIRNMVADPCP